MLERMALASAWLAVWMRWWRCVRALFGRKAIVQGSSSRVAHCKWPLLEQVDDPGVYITTILHDGAAALDGRLRVGDKVRIISLQVVFLGVSISG
jgi:hypothetical protein